MLKAIFAASFLLISTQSSAGISGGSNFIGGDPGLSGLFEPAPIVKQPIKVPAPTKKK